MLKKIIHANTALRTLTGILLIILLFVILTATNPVWFQLFMGTLLCVILFLEWPRLCAADTRLWFLTPLYPVLPFILLICLASTEQRPVLVLIVALVFAHDTGSYIAGSLFGNHKICPRISPGKSWEGFWGGYGTALLAVITIVAITHHGTQPLPISSWPHFLLIVLILCATSLCGDLFESWLKRRAHLKDSGSLLPGHGGVLDRFDGVMFVVVIVYSMKDYIRDYIPIW